MICRCARWVAQTFIPRSTVPPLRHPFRHRFLALLRAVQKIEIDHFGVSRLGARSTKVSLCSLNPIFRYFSTVVRSTKPANSTVIPLCVSDHGRRHHHRGSHLRQIPRSRGIRCLQSHRHASFQSLAIRPSSRVRTESRVPPIPVRGRCHLNNSGRLRSGFQAPSCARPC